MSHIFILMGALTLLPTVLSANDAKILRGIPYYPAAAYTHDYMRRYAALDLRIPQNATNFATVITFHGGGLVNGFRGDFYKAKTLDDVACVSAGYRLLTNATPVECLSDAAAAVAWTLKHIADYGGNPKKVFLSGYSAGGYLTLMLGMDAKWLKPFGYRPQQLAGLLASTPQASTHFTIREKTGDKTSTYLTKVDAWAPLSYAARDLSPILIMTGEPELDIPCRAEENRLLYASLLALGHPDVEYHAFPGRAHGSVWYDSGFYQEDFIRRLSRAIDHRPFSGGPNRIRAFLERGNFGTDFVSLVSRPDEPLAATCVMARGNRVDRRGDGDWLVPLLEKIATLHNGWKFEDVQRELGLFQTRKRGNHWETSAFDALRIAQMIAHKGRWQGREIISANACVHAFPLPFSFAKRLFAQADGTSAILFPLKDVTQDSRYDLFVAQWQEVIK